MIDFRLSRDPVSSIMYVKIGAQCTHQENEVLIQLIY